MNEPFILVFSEESRDHLIERGFNLLSANGDFYLFENDGSEIDLAEDQYTYTCIISFGQGTKGNEEEEK